MIPVEGAVHALKLDLSRNELKYAWTALDVKNSSSAEFHGKITESYAGISADSYVDATNVDWGSSSGPSPIGLGSSIQGPVDVVPWVGYQAPTQPATTSWSATPNVECRDFFVIGARGSGEAPQGSGSYSSNADGFGTRTWNNYLGLKESLAPFGYSDSDFKLLGLRYPALDTNPIYFVNQNYYSSIFQGVDRLISELYAQKNACGGQGQRAILAGYSQGALVVHLALRVLASSDPSMLSSSNIAGVMLVADPAKTANGNETLWEGQNVDAGSGIRNASGVWTKAFGANYGPIPSQVVGRTISICHNHDIVCAPGAGAGVSYHTSYSVGELKAMGAWIANAVR